MPEPTYDEALKNLKGSITSFKEFLAKPIEQDPYELWDADPECVHDVKPQPSGGVKCTKCRGWFCF